MSGTPLADAIIEDHQEMYTYYDKYKTATTHDERERWANQLIWEVARHAVAEEIVVYPLMEKHLGQKGLDLANEDREEHQEVKNILYKLQSMSISSSEFDPTIARVMGHLRPHNEGEEKNDLPALAAVLSAEDSAKAAKSFELTKKFVPTRAHPSAPNQPPLETLAGFLTAPLDKLRDAFTKFPTEEMKKDL